MSLFRIVILAVLLTHVGNALSTAGVHFLAENKGPAIPKRLLRMYQSTETGIEDRVSLGAITDAMKSAKSNLILNSWLYRKKSGLYVLKKLNLGNNIDDALKSKKLDTLWKYVERFNKENPTKQISVIDILRSHYQDDIVMMALVNAKQVDKTKTVANKLEADLFVGWKKKQMSGNDAFSILKLRDGGFESFTSRKYEILEDYIVFCNGKQNQKENLVNVLKRGFGSDDDLLFHLAWAKPDPLVREKVAELQTTVLLEKAENEMKVLHMDAGLHSILSSQNLVRLEKYISKLSMMYENKDVSLIGLLITKYGDEAVAIALMDAKAVDGTNGIATKLQGQQFQAWMKNDKSVDEVFDLLKLKGLGVNVVNNRGLDTLEGYINVINREKSTKVTLVGTLSARFGGDSEFVNMLETAMMHPLTKVKAKELETKLFQHWFDEEVHWKVLLKNKFKVLDEEMANSAQIRVAHEYQKFYDSKISVHSANIANHIGS
ncbi:Putative RxLR effector [Phytophthora palmivora]|uniref:RxLR effector n=1 Tax=Phytophthora palmivora TaxID=4796 RepID=A0A2P4XRT9_9STRA|nr:Putative RxLR effector [Phytophthora palmivora]